MIVASLARGRSSLAIGNIVGAAISNILGAFSLGLLFYSRGHAIQFDESTRIYSLLLLALTTLVVPIVYIARPRRLARLRFRPYWGVRRLYFSSSTSRPCS